MKYIRTDDLEDNTKDWTDIRDVRHGTRDTGHATRDSRHGCDYRLPMLSLPRFSLTGAEHVRERGSDPSFSHWPRPIGVMKLSISCFRKEAFAIPIPIPVPIAVAIAVAIHLNRGDQFLPLSLFQDFTQLDTLGRTRTKITRGS